MQGPKFDRDFARQRRYIPAMKRIVGEHLIVEADEDDDTHRNTDLIVLRAEALRIACRVRSHDYYRRYAGEFTIRSSRRSGYETELAKVLAGWGNYILYAFADPLGDDLYAWTLGDLNVFRRWHSTQLVRNQGRLPGVEQANRDGSSDFRAYTMADLPPTFVVAACTNPAAVQQQMFG